jgi:hypothetical protein
MDCEICGKPTGFLAFLRGVSHAHCARIAREKALQQQTRELREAVKKQEERIDEIHHLRFENLNHKVSVSLLLGEICHFILDIEESRIPGKLLITNSRLIQIGGVNSFAESLQNITSARSVDYAQLNLGLKVPPLRRRFLLDDPFDAEIAAEAIKALKKAKTRQK